MDFTIWQLENAGLHIQTFAWLLDFATLAGKKTTFYKSILASCEDCIKIKYCKDLKNCNNI